MFSAGGGNSGPDGMRLYFFNRTRRKMQVYQYPVALIIFFQPTMPLSYMIYGSATVLIITLLIYIFSNKKRR